MRRTWSLELSPTGSVYVSGSAVSTSASTRVRGLVRTSHLDSRLSRSRRRSRRRRRCRSRNGPSRSRFEKQQLRAGATPRLPNAERWTLDADRWTLNADPPTPVPRFLFPVSCSPFPVTRASSSSPSSACARVRTYAYTRSHLTRAPQLPSATVDRTPHIGHTSRWRWRWQPEYCALCAAVASEEAQDRNRDVKYGTSTSTQSQRYHEHPAQAPHVQQRSGLTGSPVSASALEHSYTVHGTRSTVHSLSIPALTTNSPTNDPNPPPNPAPNRPTSQPSNQTSSCHQPQPEPKLRRSPV